MIIVKYFLSSAISMLRELGSELKKLNTRLTEDIKKEENLQEEASYGIKERKREI